MEGKLIVFEGVEGSGKSTQIRRLQDWLETHRGFQELQIRDLVSSVTMTREPGGTGLGKALRTLLLDGNSSVSPRARAELLMYAADRAQHVDEVISPALAAGSWVLCDRFVDSTVAYQGYGRGISLPLIEQLNQIATQGIPHHLTLWLQLDVEIGLARSQARGKQDRMEQADIAFHQRVQQGFEALAKQHPERIVAIDAALSQDAVAQQIQTVIEQRLQQWYSPYLQRS